MSDGANSYAERVRQTAESLSGEVDQILTAAGMNDPENRARMAHALSKVTSAALLACGRAEMRRERLRDEMAMAALGVLRLTFCVSKEGVTQLDEIAPHVARAAYLYADAMLVAREKP